MLPNLIKTEAENEQFLAIVEALLACPSLTPEQEILLELLVKLIEDFEEKNYALNASTPLTHPRVDICHSTSLYFYSFSSASVLTR